MGKKVIITGSTGMVGEGVLRVCLDSPEIEKILVINRRPLHFSDSKITEIIQDNFYDFSTLEGQFKEFDACFHCMGISSVGMDEIEYKKITQDITVQLAKSLVRANKDMTFVYVSGAGTDQSENSKMWWSRIKGRTENLLNQMGFAHVYHYRPGFIKPYPGQKKAHTFYKYINWMYSFGKLLYPNGFNTMKELGLSMIQLLKQPIQTNIIFGKEISILANYSVNIIEDLTVMGIVIPSGSLSFLAKVIFPEISCSTFVSFDQPLFLLIK